MKRLNINSADEIFRTINKFKTLQLVRQHDGAPSVGSLVKHAVWAFFGDEYNFHHCPNCDAPGAIKSLVKKETEIVCRGCGESYTVKS
jgi:hypothetical protein